MTPAVESVVAVRYVRDIGTSRAFYALLGFHEQSAGKAATTAWARLAHADEILMTVPGAFITNPGDEGIAGFLARRHG